jgi:hypothetical protein
LVAAIGGALIVAVARLTLPRYEIYDHNPLYLKLDRITGEIEPCVLDSVAEQIIVTCQKANPRSPLDSFRNMSNSSPTPLQQDPIWEPDEYEVISEPAPAK